MRKFDVVGIGYPSLDYTISLNNEPALGYTSMIQNGELLKPTFGGCAVNITYLLSSFNKRCGLSMTVGKDFEKEGFKKFLEDGDISLDFVKQDNKFRTTFTYLIMSLSGEHMTLVYPGPMIPENFKPYDYSRLNAKYGLLTIGELNGNKQFMESCIEKDIPLIFSMKGDYASLDKEYLIRTFENSELIFMNSSEFEQLNKLLSQDILNFLGKDLLKAIIVTKGSNGSSVFTKNMEIKVPAFTNINVVDTAGGGDAYVAGFLNEYLENKTFKECAIMGTVLSSYIIESTGCLTNIPKLKQVEERKNIIRGESMNG